MKKHRRWFIAGLTLFITAVILVGAGIGRDEVQVVISNAKILCYSCIGIK